MKKLTIITLMLPIFIFSGCTSKLVSTNNIENINMIKTDKTISVTSKINSVYPTNQYPSNYQDVQKKLLNKAYNEHYYYLGKLNCKKITKNRIIHHFYYIKCDAAVYKTLSEIKKQHKINILKMRVREAE